MYVYVAGFRFKGFDSFLGVNNLQCFCHEEINYSCRHSLSSLISLMRLDDSPCTTSEHIYDYNLLFYALHST